MGEWEYIGFLEQSKWFGLCHLCLVSTEFLCWEVSFFLHLIFLLLHSLGEQAASHV